MDFTVQRNDIANMAVDAIVLPANTKLKEGPGASAAIFERAGREELTRACKAAAPVKVGYAVPTDAFNLPSKLIIHAVVPRWRGGKHKEYELLSQAYLSTLAMADQIGCESVAFPLLASGNSGFDVDTALGIAVTSISAFEPVGTLKDVILVTFGDEATERVRALGYEVEEVIGSDYAYDRGLAQGVIYNGSPATIGQAKMATGVPEFVDRAIEKAKELLADPKVQALAIVVAEEVLRAIKEGKLKSLSDLVALLPEIGLKLINMPGKKK